MMKLAIIVAMSQNRVIGKAGRLPWHLPADLLHFKTLTLGHPVLMGRKTHESIGRPLPGRENIVITHNPLYSAPGCVVAHSFAEALLIVEKESLVFVIGGEQLYREALPQVDLIYMTCVDVVLSGDAYFPGLTEEFREIDSVFHLADANHLYDYRFVTLERLKSKV